MRKSLKLLLLGLSATSVIAATSPLIVACSKTETIKEVVYDDTTKTLIVPSSKLFTSDKTIFNIFNVLYTSKNIQEVNVGFDQTINTLKADLATLLKLLVTDYNNANANDIVFNFQNVQFINGNQLVFDCNLNNTTVATNVIIDFPMPTKESINKYLAGNNGDEYKIKLNELYNVSSLEDIKNNLDKNTIMNLVGSKLPPNVVLFDKENDSNINAWGIDNYQIINDDINKEEVLKIAIFVPSRTENSKGLSWLKIYKEYSQVLDLTPTNELLQETPYVTNHWPIITDKIITPLEDITNFHVIDSSKQHGEILSYKEAVKLQDVQTKIDSYKNKTNVINNLIQDVDYYLRNYVYYLGQEWEDHNIVYQNIFAYRAFQYNEQNDTISGQITLEIHNKSNEDKKFLLPFNNKKEILPKQSVGTFIITMDNVNLQASISKHLTTKNLGYLTIGFSKANIKWFVSQPNFNTKIKMHDYQIYEPTQLFNYSDALNCVITNVGDGEDVLSQQQLVNQSYNQLTEEQLKYTKYDQINNEFSVFLDIFRSLQSIMLDVAKNPSVFEFLKNLSNEVYNIINAFTQNSNLSWIVADVFSNKTLSEYLHANLENIITFIQSIDTTGDMDTIVEMLKDIANSNPTLEEKEAWVKSIVGLYPTLEKLMGVNPAISWILPLLKMIMTYISNQNPPIINLVFDNLNDIINFVNTNNVSADIKAILTELLGFLNEMINFGNLTGNNNTEKYKQIKLLDVVAYEISQQNKSSSLFSLIAKIANVIDPTNTIGVVLEQLGKNLGDKYKLPNQLQDYSKANWENTTKLFGGVKNYRIKTVDIQTPKLNDHLGVIINHIFNIKFKDTNTDTTIYDVLAKHTKAEIISGINDNFNFDKTNKTVTQQFEIKYSITQDIIIDLLPIHTLLDNLELQGAPATQNSYVDGQYTVIFPKLHVDIAKLTNISSTLLKPLNLDVIGLSEALPRNLVVKKDVNFVSHKTTSNNEKLYPSIDNDGIINWTYHSQTNVDVKYTDVFNDSNEHNKEKDSNKKYYGRIYNNYTKGMLIDGKISAIGIFDFYVGFLFSMNNTISTFAPITTNLKDQAVQIKNYNPDIYLPGATVTLNKSVVDFQTALQTYINSNAGWTNNNYGGQTFTFNQQFNLNDHFQFGDTFINNNDYIGYFHGFNTLKMDIIMQTQYKYSFTLKTTQKILFTYKDNNGQDVSSLVDSDLVFNIPA